MRSIVTGGAGFIGSHIVDRLINEGHEVLVIDDKSSMTHEQFYENEKADYVDYRVEDFYEIEPLFENTDYVFHLAAEVSIQSCIKNPIYAVSSNIQGTTSVLQAAKEHNVKRVVFSSSSSVYGLTDQLPTNEEAAINCLNIYSLSKWYGEQLCNNFYKNYNLESCVLRYFNVYGERQPTESTYAPVIGTFQKQLEDQEAITIVGDGQQTRDFIHVSDVVEANIKAAFTDNNKIICNPVNIGYGESYTIIDIMKMVCGKEEPIYIHVPERIGEARDTKADISKAKKILNWEPKVNLKEWLKHETSDSISNS